MNLKLGSSFSQFPTRHQIRHSETVKFRKTLADQKTLKHFGFHTTKTKTVNLLPKEGIYIDCNFSGQVKLNMLKG